MSEDIRTSVPAVKIELKEKYDTPKLTTLGEAMALTAGPITETDESPSGMKG